MIISSLISSFDPSSSILNLPLNWSRTLLGLLIIPLSFWFIPSRINILWNKMLIAIHKEFNTILGPTKHIGRTIIFSFLVIFIIFNNLIGLLPYVFTSSSHLVFTLTLALPLWISFILYGWINNTQHIFAHLVPSDIPIILTPFIVIIEIISNIIRPGTLAVRLITNIVVGHFLLEILREITASSSTIIVPILIRRQLILLILETAVAIIQSYVFAILSTLYSREVT